jgi:HAMP domain-containing protein/cytochrome c551/c552
MSVQIVHSFRDKGKVRQKIIKHIGVATTPKHLEELKLLARSIQIELENEDVSLFDPKELRKDLDTPQEKHRTPHYKEEDYQIDIRTLKEEKRVIDGVHDVYGKIFDQLNLKSIFANPARHASAVQTFKEIVLSRIANPDSKRGSVAMLESNYGIHLNLDKVYRMMDKLDDAAIEKLNRLSYAKTKALFDDKIDVIYFDATTLYFESFTEDEGEDALKKNGYSKDLKFNQPQVVLALMVTQEGLPIGYEVFPGDTFDGHTLIPSLKTLQEKYRIDNVVYVADSGMFNQENLKELGETHFYLHNPALATRELSGLSKIEYGWTFRVVSDRYMAPESKPDKWEAIAIKKIKEGKKDEYWGWDGNKFRFAKAIRIKKGCLKCHGSLEQISPALLKAMRAKYGDNVDRAINYKEGDLRGIVSVTILPPSIIATALSLIDAWNIGAFVVAFLVFWFFAKNEIIKPIEKITKAAHDISLGKLDIDLGVRGLKEEEVADEITKLAIAIDRLRASIQIAMERLRKK